MTIVESSIEIQQSQDKLFALAQDYGLRLEWDPFLSDLKFLNGATAAAAGVRVWVKAASGLTMEVEYVVVEPPDRVATKMVSGPFFFERFAGTWRFVEKCPGQTSVHFRYSFSTRWRPLRPIIDPLIRRVFTRNIVARLRGLKRAAESTDILARLDAS